jgi:tRNA (Thr-GGU) A37 N-methylase
MLEQTPVLDVKPYVPEFDSRSTTRIGWFEQRLALLPDAVSDDRMRWHGRSAHARQSTPIMTFDDLTMP